MYLVQVRGHAAHGNHLGRFKSYGCLTPPPGSRRMSGAQHENQTCFSFPGDSNV